MTDRFCKTCRYLERYTYASSGKATDPHDDYGFRCAWFKMHPLPWAEGLALSFAKTNAGAGIGKRHVEGDWSEAMDCPVWEATP